MAGNPWSLPEVRITVDRALDDDPVDVTLTYPLTGAQDTLLRELYEAGNRQGVIECRMHDDDPKLRCYRRPDGRVRGAWLLLAQWPGQPGRLLLKHWPGGLIGGTHAVPSRMTPEHRHRQEYIAARGASFGYAVELEKKLATGLRPDVVVVGTAATMAAEVQMVPITAASLIRRSNGARAAGLESVWFPGVDARSYAFKVPHVEAARDGAAAMDCHHRPPHAGARAVRSVVTAGVPDPPIRSAYLVRSMAPDVGADVRAGRR